MTRVLLADPDASTLRAMQALCQRRGYALDHAADGTRLLRLLAAGEFDLVALEQRLPGRDGLQVLQDLRRTHPHAAVILLSAFVKVEEALSAMREGADDYLSKPFSEPEIELAVERALEQSRLVQENETLREALDDRLRIDNVIATDPKMQSIF